MASIQMDIFGSAQAAVKAGALSDMERLLLENSWLAAFRAPPDENGNQNTLLHEATGMGIVAWTENAPAIAQLLLDHGAEVDAPEREEGGETPLIHAVSINNVPVARVLLENVADTEKTGRYDGALDTALGYALFYGRDARQQRFPTDCPELLLEYGAKLKAPFAAAMYRNAEAKQLLAQEERRLSLQHSLLFAAQYGNLEMLEYLLEAGAGINVLTPFFHFRAAALHLACMAGDQVEAVRFLLGRGADPGLRDELYGANALGWARYNEQQRVARLLSGL